MKVAVYNEPNPLYPNIPLSKYFREIIDCDLETDEVGFDENGACINNAQCRDESRDRHDGYACDYATCFSLKRHEDIQSSSRRPTE